MRYDTYFIFWMGLYLCVGAKQFWRQTYFGVGTSPGEAVGFALNHFSGDNPYTDFTAGVARNTGFAGTSKVTKSGARQISLAVSNFLNSAGPFVSEIKECSYEPLWNSSSLSYIFKRYEEKYKEMYIDHLLNVAWKLGPDLDPRRYDPGHIQFIFDEVLEDIYPSYFKRKKKKKKD